MYNPQLRKSRNKTFGGARYNYYLPLVLLQFWRIILDEVQMVSNTVSNASKLTKILSRCHSWGVSGTPIRKKMGDLFYFLLFLRREPFISKEGSWLDLLNNEYLCDFLKLSCLLGIRHDKHMVKDDIRLPSQKRILLTVPFTPIEQSNYEELYNKFLCSVYLNAKGEPTINDWEPNSAVQFTMAKWLVRLRQTCCHANIARNRLKNTAIGTMNEVLIRFIGQVKSDLNQLEKTNCSIIFQRSEIMVHLGRPFEFKKILKNYYPTIIGKIKSIEKEILEISGHDESESKNIMDELLFKDLSDEDVKHNSASEGTLGLKLRLKSWVEILHKYYFFTATSHYQISVHISNNQHLDEARFENIVKSKANLTDEENGVIVEEISESNYIKNKRLEDHYYGKAEEIRNKLLVYHATKVEKLVQNFKEKRAKIHLEEISVLEIVPDGLVDVTNDKIRFILTDLFNIIEELNSQARRMNQWIEQSRDILISDLLSYELKGEEYGQSLLEQDKVCYLFIVLEKAFLHRKIAINGRSSNYELVLEISISKMFVHRFVDDNQKQEKKSREIEEFKESLKAELLEVQPTSCQRKKFDFFSMKGCLEKICSLQKQVNKSEFTTREREKLEIINFKVTKVVGQLNDSILEHKKTIFEELNSMYNTRVEYYRQLQMISDSVKPIDLNQFNGRLIEKFERLSLKEQREHLEEVDSQLVEKLRKNKIQISHDRGKLHYLESLSKKSSSSNKASKDGEKHGEGDDDDNDDDDDDDRICIICTSSISVGVLTECGHQYCKNCLYQWLSIHKNCPICKQSVSKSSVYSFKFNRQDLRVKLLSDKNNEEKYDIYKKMDEERLGEIDQNEIGQKYRYGSKVDIIVKLVKWLKSGKEDVQIVVFFLMGRVLVCNWSSFDA
ncbi:uncharacterized protein ASCRUDRAFT_145479 [Ascoidea rubescens DSM 1968]|uniref:RING-type domain-containing protein n=1 Tax=Ascoidea rubescens DSM 1968 TaxID=1344418 RepID=A0A1D2VHR4_9ASCO|nr:hypothetical protein ASCRUDRAFT_145479 [Ascoidea rubescens DSM 1968]ODV61017.1 hypothetical protein ASCRUDRAFT_145479 [Ascoidea rubescens DSM 1968]